MYSRRPQKIGVYVCMCSCTWVLHRAVCFLCTHSCWAGLFSLAFFCVCRFCTNPLLFLTPWSRSLLTRTGLDWENGKGKVFRFPSFGVDCSPTVFVELPLPNTASVFCGCTGRTFASLCLLHFSKLQTPQVWEYCSIRFCVCECVLLLFMVKPFLSCPSAATKSHSLDVGVNNAWQWRKGGPPKLARKGSKANNDTKKERLGGKITTSDEYSTGMKTCP